MTECERLVADGTIRKEFLSEEIRNDFLVTEERKKLWAILLDLLKKLDEVCKRYNLRYFATGGTLLGAVRHQGFIPWDDDLDFAMLREDYEELLRHSDAFEAPYFLQTPYTDSRYYYSFAKLGNDNTTYCSKMFAYQGFHAGISLDIFPIDYWDYQKGKAVYDRIAYLNKENSTYMRMKNPYLDEKNKQRVMNWSRIDPLAAYEEIQKLASQFDNEHSDSLSNAVITIWKYGNDIYPKSVFKKQTYFPFEGYSIPAPCGYDVLLRNLYGDYMSFPPVNKRGIWHADTIIDPDVPYTVCLKNMQQKIQSPDE